MQKVNETISSNMTNYLTNYKAWAPVTYNVAAYGIVGDGIQDNTNAIQSLIYLAISEQRKAIFFQPGIYIINELKHADKVVFFGDNATVVGSFTGKIHQIGVWANNADVQEIEEQLVLKADKTQVNQLATAKADKVYVDAQLTEKANEADVISLENNKAEKSQVEALAVNKADATFVQNLVASISDGTPEAFASLAAIQAAYPNGDNYVKLNEEDGYVYKWNGTMWEQGWKYQTTGIDDWSLTYNQIAPKGISRARSKFFKKLDGSNLFDKDEEVNLNGYYTLEGVFVNSSGYGSTGFIEIKPNTSYVGNLSGAITFWDSTKSFISGNAWQTPFTTPSNAKYVNIAFAKIDIDKFYLYEGAISKPLGLTRYRDEKLIVDGYQVTGAVSNDLLTEALEYDNSSNLLDKTKINRNGYYNGDGVFTPNASYFASDFIEVTPDTTYSHLRQGIVTFWDANKKFVSSVSSAQSNPFTVPIGVRYVVITVFEADVDADMLVKGEVFPTTYRPYGKKYTLKDNINVPIVKSELFGLRWNVLGDSITAGLGASTPYHAVIATKHGMTVNNYGISGSRIAVWPGHDQPMVTRYSTMADNADIITVFGGTNDEANSVTLGDINSTDTGTFYGALNVLCLGLIQKYPGKRIGFITPMMKRNVDYAKMQLYVDAFYKVCAKHSIPLLDLFAGCGLYPNDDTINNTFFYNADGLHPNNAGHPVIARRIEQFIKSL